MAETWKKLAFEDDVVLKAAFDAQSVLAATVAGTPAAVTLAEQKLLGRLTGGNIAAVSIGIADNSILQVDDAAAASGEFAQFTANGLKGRSVSETLTDLGVEAGADVTADHDPKAHAASHKDGGTDEIATATPTANAIPKADASGKLNAWVDAPSGVLYAANNLSDVASPSTAFDNIKQAATTSTTGVVELATDGESLSGKVVQGNDSRLSNARTPTPHAPSHKNGGADELKLNELGEPTAAVNINGQQLQNMVVHTVADELERDALTQVVGMMVWQANTNAAYICTSAV